MTSRVWDEDRARGWLSRLDGMEAELAPVSDVLFEVAALQPGMDVLDVGCGGGSTTRRAAALVQPGGSVTGLDISPTMIDAARSLSGDAPIRWVATDIVEDGLATDAYDLVLSRCGVMFFSDRALAFSRLAAATRPGGRLCAAVWRSPGDVPLFDVPYDAVVTALRAHGIDLPDDQSPGTSLGDQDQTRELLEGAGWSDVSFHASDVPLYVNGPAPLDQVVDIALQQGSVRLLLAGQPESTLAIAREGLHAALTPLHDGVGVGLPGGFMIISAVRR